MHARHNAAHQFIGVMDQVAEQTERSIQRELSQKEGVQFDRCFLSWQVLDHMWLVNALTVFRTKCLAGPATDLARRFADCPAALDPRQGTLVAT